MPRGRSRSGRDPDRQQDRGAERCRTGGACRSHYCLCKIDAGAEGACRACPPRQGARGRIPRRRYQRQPCPEAGGRGNFRRYRGRYCQGVGRYHPARKKPACPAGGRDRRPQGFCEHHEIHQDGRELELWKHVQRAWRKPLPAIPADGADTGPDQQSALRLFPDRAIPTDNVDEEYLASPRRWDIGNIFKFMVFIGPMSSIFDYATYGMMLFVFGAWTNPALFQTGWFVESLLTQTLIIHIIRTAKIPF